MASAQEALMNTNHRTRVLKVDVSKIGAFVFQDQQLGFLGDWDIQLSEASVDAANLQEAATRLRDGDLPVAFPTETVYGLGADATRSSAVRGIYNAKRRPSDNPLITHISSLPQLRRMLSPLDKSPAGLAASQDPIPSIYHPLIAKFWPGPLTILLPLPTPSPLAAEVTASQPTVAVRMPSSRLALALIKLAKLPLAAPSANASSKPSPTTAGHVLQDLSGRIDLILDGGPCEVGVESTVVDGLSDPPVVLRPGGISVDILREIPGWKDVRIAYKDSNQKEKPRVPGMKYRHYSPNAKVVLIHSDTDAETIRNQIKTARSVGLLTTERWSPQVFGVRHEGHHESGLPDKESGQIHADLGKRKPEEIIKAKDIENTSENPTLAAYHSTLDFHGKGDHPVDVWTIALGQDVDGIARGLFSALRALDQKNVEVILVEGIDDGEEGARAAIVNRLRKAAELEINP
ncbi:hypothetical protein ACLMJK_008074 [Lecanora helva]